MAEKAAGAVRPAMARREAVLESRLPRVGQWLPLLVIAPSVVAILVFVYGFILWTTLVSVSRWQGIVPDFTFVGFRNYATIFLSYRFQSDLRNTIVFTVFFLLGSLAIGLLLAVLLDSKVRGESFFRTVYLFPMAISFVVTGTAWQWLFVPGTPQEPTGLNLLFRKLGLPIFIDWSTTSDVWPNGGLQVEWLRVPLGIPLAMLPVIIAAIWQMSGFTMAMYLAALRGIPDELREAARVDGASEWQVFRYITFPLLQPITLSAVIVLGHISLKIFDLIMTQTGGGPGFATDVPGIFMYETTFKSNKYAEGASIAIVMLVMVSILIVPYLIWRLRSETER
ncbi:sugar ABC transporter permease [Thermomicrobium sp. 4228-Ro]|uniref:carbohydrate ABC transporter permease n=1 Tax=Thermomicrobium sp. 4228-Ro TaxID=2993937 RepID=UPI0022497BE9|nr:sugar ABC transporter permease [Thermomicrobium sp. 4228-Ro]MCX2728523.1 sugar ABC transporter permease [Thermomicrobium sp. 4228-Ro]